MWSFYSYDAGNIEVLAPDLETDFLWEAGEEVEGFWLRLAFCRAFGVSRLGRRRIRHSSHCGGFDERWTIIDEYLESERGVGGEIIYPMFELGSRLDASRVILSSGITEHMLAINPLFY